jgi:molybdate transport system regulatory protein
LTTLTARVILLAEMHGREHRRHRRLEMRHKVWLDADGRFAVGDGGTDLLCAIEATGSVRAAAARVGWSYRHTLAYLDNAEQALRRKLVERSRGGQERGGAHLNADGRDFLRRYTRFRRRAQTVVLGLYQTAFGHGRWPGVEQPRLRRRAENARGGGERHR